MCVQDIYMHGTRMAVREQRAGVGFSLHTVVLWINVSDTVEEEGSWSILIWKGPNRKARIFITSHCRARRMPAERSIAHLLPVLCASWVKCQPYARMEVGLSI